LGEGQGEGRSGALQALSPEAGERERCCPLPKEREKEVISPEAGERG